MILSLSTIACALGLANAWRHPAPPAPIKISQCNSGDIYCCDSAQQAGDPLSGVHREKVNALNIAPHELIWLDCDPLSIIGIDSGNKCSQQAVCCQGNNQDGLVNVNCSPITL